MCLRWRDELSFAMWVLVTDDLVEALGAAIDLDCRLLVSALNLAEVHVAAG